MASGSKKVSNIPLSKEEQEEEELRNELINSRSGFFYEGMGVDEMKMILNELKKSKEISSQNSEPVSAQFLNESNSTQNTSQASESTVERPLPSFSYRQAVTSNLSTASSTNEDIFDNREKSPDLASNKGYGINLNNEHNNSHDSESIFEKNSNSNKDDYPQLGSKYNLKGNSNEYSTRLRPREAKKPTPAMTKKASLERWRLDPFQFLADDDVPLKQPERTFAEENLPYSKNWNEELDNETFDALCRQMSEKLDSCHRQIIARDYKTVWGSPIKISVKRSGPADKNSFLEKIPASSSNTADISVRDTFERSSKRKALNIITAVTQIDSNDENSDEEFVNTKKRKCQQGKKTEGIPRKNQDNQENKNNSFEMIEVNQTDDFPDSEFDNSDLPTLNRTKRTKVSIDTKANDNELVYPRRITPPNPVKKNCKGPRYKKKNSIQSQTTAKKNSESLDDNEISQILNETDEVDDNDCIEITHEIKPLSISKETQKKLGMAQSYLEDRKNADDRKTQLENEARKKKEMEEKLKKDELISKRLQEQEDKISRELEKQKKLNEQELVYKNILGTNRRVTRSNFIPKTPRNYAEMSEDQLLADDDVITLTHNDNVTQNCPICQKSFPHDQIQTHASECNLFTSESDDIDIFQPSTSYSRQDNSYDCGICNKYTTFDGKTYEEHVTKCRENAEDQRANGIYA